MRIERMVVRNINSLFGSFEIDFSDKEYAEGLFAIVGPSGAGKSTILDAMCLALYGRTPRITLSDMHNEAMNRNADNCYSEVVFVSAGKRYRSTFEHRRTIRSAKPFMSPKNEIYEYLDDGSQKALSDKSTEARQKVVSIVGLDYDQFTRSVMLAQFKFAEFLSANSGQRAEILEQVSGTDIYRRISIAVYNKQKQYKTGIEEIRIKKETINVLEPEEVKTIKDELKQIDESIAQIELFKSKTDESITLIREKDTNEQALKGFEDNKQRIAKTLETNSKDFNLALTEEKKQKQHSAQLQKLLKEIRALDHAIATAKKEQNRLKTDIDSADSEIIKHKKSILAVLKKHLPDADDGQLRQLYDADNEAQIIREHLGKELKQAEEKETELKQQRNKVLVGKTEKFWTEKQEKLEEALPLIKARGEIKATNDELAELKKKLDKLKAEDKLLVSSIKENEEKLLYAKLQEKYKEQRKLLEDGAPCPLCGALEHPSAHEHLDTSFVNAAQEEKKNLDVQKDKLMARINDIAFAVSTKTKLISDNEELLRGKEELLKDFEGAGTESVQRETVQIKQMLTKSRQLAEQISAVGVDVLRLTKQLSEVDKDVSDIKNAKDNIRAIEKRKDITKKALDEALKETADLVSKRQTMFGSKDADTEEENQAVKMEKAEKDTESARLRSEQTKAEEAGNAADIGRTKARIEELLEKLEDTFGDVLKMAQNLQKHNTGQADFFEAALSHIEELETSAQKSRDILPQLAQALGAVSTKLKERTGEARNKLSENEQKKTMVKTLLSQEKELGTLYKKWSDLNSIIGSADGIKFSRIAQGITFDVLLQFANESLKKMSDRYVLIRDDKNQTSPLEINVVDNYQAGDIRPVNNLSGGESFIVSMALALGLSEMSSGRTQIDSLFIDEGFASLDENYLELALQTLSTLGNRQNKLIGIISHVKELKERIDTQIEVTALSGGRSMIEGPGVTAL